VIESISITTGHSLATHDITPPPPPLPAHLATSARGTASRHNNNAGLLLLLVPSERKSAPCATRPLIDADAAPNSNSAPRLHSRPDATVSSESEHSDERERVVLLLAARDKPCFSVPRDSAAACLSGKFAEKDTPARQGAIHTLSHTIQPLVLSAVT
jgi:hypothetical protein